MPEVLAENRSMAWNGVCDCLYLPREYGLRFGRANGKAVFPLFRLSPLFMLLKETKKEIRDSVMNGIGCVRLAIAALVLCTGLSACGNNRGAVSEKPDFSGLDSLVETWVDKGYYPGAAIRVRRDSSVLFEKCYGNVGGGTSVYVASAGKWVAAAVVAAVVDRTDLSWDDTVERWLPEFGGDPKGKIRLRQLLSHTSGIRPYLPEPRVDNYNHLDSAVAEILPLDTVFTPGTRFEYGGLAMQVAGRMAEVAAGKEFEDLFQELLARPLRMKASHFTPVNTDGGHAPMLGGGLCTTLDDYMNFLDMIAHGGVFEGKRILEAETVREMQADQVRGAKVRPGEYVERALGQHHNGIYGLGEWRELVDGKTGEAQRVSSPGWAGAYPWIDLRTGVYGFFIAHVVGGSEKPDGFSSFYGSPVIADMVEKALQGD